jgi:hypothetical protein
LHFTGKLRQSKQNRRKRQKDVRDRRIYTRQKETRQHKDTRKREDIKNTRKQIDTGNIKIQGSKRERGKYEREQNGNQCFN